MMASSLGRAGLEVGAGPGHGAAGTGEGCGSLVWAGGRLAPLALGLCILLWGRDLFPDGPLASLLALPGGGVT